MPSTTQETYSQACPEWIKSMLEETLANNPTWPGIQLTVTSPRCGLDFTTSVQSNASNFAHEPALTDDVPWRLASITKTFTAVALLKLVERNQLDLHASALQYVPEWTADLIRQSQGDSDAAKITTWHLLHHTSGLGDFASDPRFMQEIFESPQHEWTPKSVIEWSTANSKSVGAPGENFHYTDTGYTVLGLILENLTGMGLAAAVRDLTGLDELDMPSTWWELLEPEPAGSLKRAGQYYEDVDTTHFNPTFDLFGAGGLITNSKDLNKFGRAMLEGRILNGESMKLLYILESSKLYGSGVVSYSFGDQQGWGHTGFWRTWLYWIPSLDLVISGASNQAKSDQFDANKLVRGIIDRGCRPEQVNS